MAQEEPFLASEEDVEESALVAAKKKGRKPGMETNAVRKALSFPNISNRSDKGGGGRGIVCFRCGKPDRTIKDCPFHTESS